MPVIRYNSQWGIFEFLDGFGYHEFESCTLEMRAKRNFISAKEESKTSHINQSYYQLVAKNGKEKATETVAFQKNMKHVNKGVVDQYHIVFTVIYLVKETTNQMWVNNLQFVGLDPLNLPTWDEWVYKIKPFLQGNVLFNIEENIDFDKKYTILPE